MKAALGVLILIASCVMAPSARAFDSARDLAEACRSLEAGKSGSGRQISIPSNKDALLCWGYMEAMQDMSVLVDENGGRLIGSCPPEDTTLLQLVQTFVRYARGHSGELQDKPSVVVIRALHGAYPCQRVRLPETSEQK
jgi:hypothetical protein